MGAPLRPGVAIGHLALSSPDIKSTLAFFALLDARSVFQTDGMAILEVRGGTHLIVRAGEAATVGFDLMVDDPDALRSLLIDEGYEPSPMREGGVHRSFSVEDRAGVEHRLTSSHVVGPV
jgi:catechol 2,3-dioxygenase-like lactoylglutathione lyase family enzyme